MGAVEAFFPGTVGTLGAFVLALFFLARSIRADSNKRLDAYTSRLEGRVTDLEASLTLEQHRRYLLEAILRTSGLAIPEWSKDPHNGVDPAEPVTLPSTKNRRQL